MRRLTCVGARGALVLLLALVLVMSSYVTHGIRTTPSALRSADALPDETTTPSAAGGNIHYEGQTTVPHQEKGQAGREGEWEADDEEGMVKESAVTGSRLPDCTHACGPCFPCKRVMVSFRCAEAAESCPVAYRCMCRGRFFHVPTL